MMIIYFINLIKLQKVMTDVAPINPSQNDAHIVLTPYGTYPQKKTPYGTSGPYK